MKRQNNNVILSIIIIIIYVALLMPMQTRCQPNNVTKLNILVPVREFNDFVAIKRDPITGVNNYSGFAIQVFEEVMANLPSYTHHFVPFENNMGTMNGSFDDMLKNVSSKEYDGAVGEITILYVRSDWVDFTMPYLESPIAMLVRIQQQSSSTNDVGFSLIQITYAFLITSYALSFIVATFSVVCITNWSTLFGGKDNNHNPRDATMRALIQTRLLMTTFTLIVVILIAMYIVSQASPNNVSQRGSAMVKNVNQLIGNGANVGYREGSFLYDLLTEKGIDRSKLKSLKSEDEMVDMLSKGTSNGGVDAIVANAPHLKPLQAKHCNNFTVVLTPNLHSVGIGFAFGIDSKIGREVSKGILKITDNGKLGKIQDRTIGNLEACKDDDDNKQQTTLVFSYLSPQHKWIFIVGSILVFFLTILYIIGLF